MILESFSCIFSYCLPIKKGVALPIHNFEFPARKDADSVDSEEVNNVKNLQTDKRPYVLAADNGRS